MALKTTLPDGQLMLNIVEIETTVFLATVILIKPLSDLVPLRISFD